MNELEQQIYQEQSPITAPYTTDGLLGSTALSTTEVAEVIPIDDQVPRSWSLHLSGADSIPITKL